MIMDKKVNIYPRKPITNVVPPIRCVCYNVTKPIGIIEICLLNGATVEEILPSGEIIELNLSNYDKDNSIPVVEKEDIDIVNVSSLEINTMPTEEIVEQTAIENTSETLDPQEEITEDSIQEEISENNTEESTVQDDQINIKKNNKKRRHH
jgi:hypothetical protein